MKKLFKTLKRKWAEYLLEILVIIIGVMGAFLLNNWNEDRKSTKQEIKILRELNNDLKTNLTEVIGTYNDTNIRQLSSILILDYFKNKRPVDDSLKLAFEIITGGGIFNIANTAYKFIENQGVNTLSNDSLRIKITEMYERILKNIDVRDARNWEIITEELLPLMDKYFVSSPALDRDVPMFVEETNTPKDIESLRENTEFMNVMLRLQNFLHVRMSSKKETLTKLEQLIINVQIEIDRLSN